MTASGTASAALLLMLLLVASAMFGWSSVSESVNGAVKFPGWAMAGALFGFVCAIVLTFKPKLARVLAPVYAIAEGVFVGAISKVFNSAYDGIVIQAVGITLGVFVTMLVLYRTGVIRVTDKMRRTIIGATMGIAIFYGVWLRKITENDPERRKKALEFQSVVDKIFSYGGLRSESDESPILLARRFRELAGFSDGELTEIADVSLAALNERREAVEKTLASSPA